MKLNLLVILIASSSPLAAQVLETHSISTDSLYGFGNQYGASVTGLGDVDGDGVEDIAVGAPFIDLGEDAVVIHFMEPDGTPRADQVLGQGQGGLDTSYGSFGEGIAAPGDLDGDGIRELYVGETCSAASPFGQCFGVVHGLFLNADGTLRTQVTIGNGSGGFGGTITANTGFGRNTAALGDLNDDGVPDLAVSELTAFWILFLEADGTVESERKIDSAAAGVTLGAIYSLAGLGDLDGDLVEDLAVGNAFTNSVLVFFLNADGTVRSHVRIGMNSGGFRGRLDGQEGFGVDVANVGDRDGDGIVDLAVAAPGDETMGASEPGALWMLFLNANGTVKAHEKITQVHGGFTGEVEDGWPNSVAAVGDLDDDGMTDLVAGAVFCIGDLGYFGEAFVLLMEDGIHAGAIGANGSGTNSAIFESTSLPVLGTNWTAEVDASVHPGASNVYLLARAGAREPPLGTAWGEVLIDPASANILLLVQPSTGGVDVFTVPIPNNLALRGMPVFTQTVTQGGGIHISNAIDLVLGL